MSSKANFTEISNDKLLECPFVDDCVLKEKVSCNTHEFPDFLNCTEYQVKKRNLFRYRTKIIRG